MENYITVLPNAASLIESMRSIGYSFETAIADIIDNSISAHAEEIRIYNRKIDGTPYVQVIDDGVGMSDDELIEAMRLGSKNPNEIRSKDDLGRFGLGLKSASFSQCRILTVVSNKNGKTNGYQWDLNFVQETNRFHVKKLSSSELKVLPNIKDLERMQSGTIVQWENFDRISNSSHDLENELSILMNKTIDHISLIFHRFIDEGLKISVNFEPVIPKDPFLVKHVGTQELITKKVKIDNEMIHLYPYILPHFSKLNSADQRKSGKVSEHYKAQGFYIYRNKRLIIWGDYLGLARKSELGKNVRIRVDIPNSLDHLWEIDVKKSRANVPSKIKNNLLSAISDGDLVSKRVNTYRGKREISEERPIWLFLTGREEEFHFEVNQKNDLYIQFMNTLDENQKSLFNMLSKSLAASIPCQTIYSQISGGKTNQNRDDDLVSDLKSTIEQLRSTKLVDTNVWLRMLLSEEPYKSNENAVKFINKELGE
ncbi:ATP-binding protein [Proteiniclasticum sp. C24MP]|uniref:ATP-binding protein n=1 Tax=Proteiniclasticum sp. C24MP TaxID=3374101 RepID=UPI003754505C